MEFLIAIFRYIMLHDASILFWSVLVMSIGISIFISLWAWRRVHKRTHLLVAWLFFLACMGAGVWEVTTHQQRAQERLRMRLLDFAQSYAVVFEHAEHWRIPTPPLETRFDAKTNEELREPAPLSEENQQVYKKLLDLASELQGKVATVATVYTLRKSEEGDVQLIISPAADINNDGVIDYDSVLEAADSPGTLFEEYPHELDEVFSEKTNPFYTSEPVADRWGTWLTAAAVIHKPDNSFDALVCVDFHVRQLQSLEPKLVYGYILGMLAALTICWLVFAGATFATESLERMTHQNAVLNEAKLLAEEAAKSKTHFLANMSHEIRTPMNAIIGFTDIIGRKLLRRCRPDEVPECRRSLEIIHQSGADLLTIINDILDFSKIEAGLLSVEKIPISIKTLLHDVGAMMHSRMKDGVDFVIEIADDVPEWIFTDPTRLRQIIINLLGNAMKFTESGSVILRCTQKTTSANSVIFIAIEDTGIGMTAEQVGRLFQPFAQADASLTRRFGGTGLGLTISKRLATLLQGAITVKSEHGKGSSFTIQMVVKIPTAAEVAQAESYHATEKTGVMSIREKQMEKPLAGCRLLVVEDVRINQLVITTQLEEMGAFVMVATNGQIALEMIEKNVSYDAVLMDMQMPVMDGYEATRTLRSRAYSGTIIAVTAQALAQDCEQTLEAGCNDYISKPIDRNKLVEMILKYW